VTVLSRRWRVARTGIAASLLAASTLGVALVGALTPAAASAATAKVGYVRLAHLSPDTPDVNVYLDSVSTSAKEQVFKGVGYGVMSAYLPLPAGEYAVSMRFTSDPTGPVVLTTDVTVAAGQAYTVAGVGRRVDLGLKVYHDDLSSPAHGKSKVRVIQASIKDPQLNVSLTNGTKIASNVAFATTTSYKQVNAGNWTLVVRPSSGGKSVDLHVDLKADSVYSLLILDGKTTLTADLKVDATRAGSAPVGGVATGLGGSSPRNMPTIAVSVLALAGLAFGGIAIASRRRSNSKLVAPLRSGAARRMSPPARTSGGRASDRA
jgi:Domain of unknown function (DUF4397)